MPNFMALLRIARPVRGRERALERWARQTGPRARKGAINLWFPYALSVGTAVP